MLLIKQAYMIRKLKNSPPDLSQLRILHSIQRTIQEWYANRSKKVQKQTRKDEFQSSEKTRIYHHELHQKSIKRKSILKLNTDEGLLEGHNECSSFLEKTLRELLESPAELDSPSQEIVLAQVTPTISEADNKTLEEPTTLSEVYSILSSSNISAAAGTDGISGLLYKVCWKSLGIHLYDLIKDLFSHKSPTTYMRTALMVFSTKPKKGELSQTWFKKKDIHPQFRFQSL